MSDPKIRQERDPRTTGCVLCGRRDDKPSIVERQELFDQTPIEVWRGYMANGYRWQQMISEEFSYV